MKNLLLLLVFKTEERPGQYVQFFPVLVFEIYSGFGSVTVFLKVTNFGYCSVSVSLKIGRLTCQTLRGPQGVLPKGVMEYI